jgi:hypothetical protein
MTLVGSQQLAESDRGAARRGERSSPSLTRLEVFWAGLVLPSFAGSGAGFTVREGEVDYLAGLARFMGSASEKAKLGIRFAFFLAVTTPVWIGGRLRGFASLSPEERSEHLDAMSRHRIFLVRELCLLLKLIACMAIFRAPTTRERTGYDGDPAREPARTRRALPVLRAARDEAISGERATSNSDRPVDRPEDRQEALRSAS